jgi:hypothetical protein
MLRTDLRTRFMIYVSTMLALAGTSRGFFARERGRKGCVSVRLGCAVVKAAANTRDVPLTV